jgi:hypothetical protein
MCGWVASILGWLTLAGLVLLIVAYVTRLNEVPYPLPICLLCSGALLFFVAGLPWAHTRGNRKLKAAFLGTVGFACGGTAGAVAGAAVAETVGGDNRLGMQILGLIGGF